MRLRHPDGSLIHLAYCSNVHPAEDPEGIHAQLRRFAGPVRERLGVDRLGVGLWLPAATAALLAADARKLDALRAVLDEQGLEVVTLNAFPYGGFHDRVVKHRVYRPDWTEPERLAFTLDAATVLAGLLPGDAARGSISTLPLAWHTPWSDDARGLARANLDALAVGLERLRERTGRHIRVGFEPEPGCVIETTEEAIAELAGVDTTHLGVCVDACHLATAFEDAGTAVAALASAGLPVVKAQLSAALHVADPAAAATRELLEEFVEERFLHQVREPAPGGGLLHRDDLPDALAGDALPASEPWRIHFHLPLHAAPSAPLAGTGAELVETMRALVGGDRPLTDHLEVETYTWTVLPEGQRPTDDAGLVAGIAAELAQARSHAHDLGLENA
ncbi:metabolite traffic protein EboE [Pseudactinotalea sp. HY158]|uniref:metabolite traffic protein EboE n=1 Tax=Pseudactinotalea sp. HY158 TaxID=2654547 RepID=UPI00129D0BBC|nr:metabolite traffic protein EboE [Pseudactinotalea sp. HY158]QGH70043.1 metabolite traffic protein EboE [Pseudactinotalea sp. HY158]